MFRYLWRDLRAFLPPKSRARAGLLIVESLIAGLLEALLLVLVVSATLAVADGSDGVSFSVAILGERQLTMAIALAVAGAAGIVVVAIHLHIARITAQLSAGVLRMARGRALSAFACASWARQALDREGALQETTSTLSMQTATIVLQLANLATAATALAALLAAAFVVDPGVTLIVLLFGGLLFVALRPIGRITRARAKNYVSRNSDFSEEMSQWGTLAMELRVFGVEELELDRLAAHNNSTANALLRTRFMSRVGSSLYRDLAVLFLVAAVAVLFFVGTVDLAAVGAVVLLIVRSLGYAQTVNTAMQGVHEQWPNLESLTQRLTSLEAEAEVVGERPIGTFAGVRLDHVDYDYEPGRPGIADVSLKIDAGEALGVIGPSGGGKSTLVQVILRLRPPTRGTVTVSGIPYEDIEPASWHRLVALVSQEPRLFQGTVADNITFLRPGFTRQQIEVAAASAHVRDDILQLSEGFDTQLGPRGAGLSGGQKQRIAIARALIGNPQLLVLDEPTSALDVSSEQLLQETIEDLKGRVTLVIIAHRITTLACCDRVLAMKEGRVEAIGSLEEALSHLSFTERLLNPVTSLESKGVDSYKADGR